MEWITLRPSHLERIRCELDSPLVGAIRCNVTDTSLSNTVTLRYLVQYFFYWHFPVHEEHRANQENETSDGIFPSLFPADKRKKRRGGMLTFFLLSQKSEAVSQCGGAPVTAFCFRECYRITYQIRYKSNSILSIMLRD